MKNQPEPRRTATPGDALRSFRSALIFHRARAWVLVGFFATGFLVGLVGILSDPSTWPSYVLSLGGMLAVFHCLPRLRERSPPSGRVVAPFGNTWQVGRYSEADLRALLHEVLGGLPDVNRPPQVYVLDDPTVSAEAWERFPWFLFGRPDRRVGITSGSLHYLEPDEVKAVLLHEIAHLRPGCRLVPVNLPLLADLALHALAIWSCSRTGSLAASLLMFFLAPRVVVHALLHTVLAAARRVLEHVCDLFAAGHMGEAAMINALLKLGEDDELTEILVARIVTRLADARGIDLDEVARACLETRPHGRIFHENLFRHASAAVAKLEEQGRIPGSGAPAGGGRSRELQRFLARRRRHRRPRIRWRAFDADADGSLGSGEIARLCRALREHPDHVLVAGETGWLGELHPPYRSRALVLHDHAVERQHRAD